MSRFRRISSHPLFPLPKVYVPLFASYINAGQVLITTGHVDKLTLSLLFAGTAWGAIGYATPSR